MFGNEGDLLSTILWFGFFILFAFLGPKLMVTQSIIKLEKDVADLEEMTANGINYLTKKVKNGNKKQIMRYINFFSVMPIQTDPYGIMKKIDHLVKMSDRKLDYFAAQISPNATKIERMNLKNGLAGVMTSHQIAKAIRHWLELIKKYKMFQFAMIIQMQLPLIKEFAKAANNATVAFMDGVPIGDGIGPLVATNMMKGKVKVYEDEEFAVCKTTLGNKTLFVSKASGPGATTGYPGKFLKKFTKNNKINRIITIDAGLKLEGEKTGSLSEGVGVAMGGIGTERYEIEAIAVNDNIPLDAVVIKESEIDALSCMSNDVLTSLPKATRLVKEVINSNNKKEKILIIGVGNTCGVSDNYKDVENIWNSIKTYNKKHAKNEKKQGWF